MTSLLLVHYCIKAIHAWDIPSPGSDAKVLPHGTINHSYTRVMCIRVFAFFLLLSFLHSFWGIYFAVRDTILLVIPRSGVSNPCAGMFLHTGAFGFLAPRSRSVYWVLLIISTTSSSKVSFHCPVRNGTRKGKGRRQRARGETYRRASSWHRRQGSRQCRPPWRDRGSSSR